MYSDARKLNLIKEMLDVESDAVLTKLEYILKDELSLKDKEKKSAEAKPSDYAGCISQQTAKELLQYVEQSRNEWERDI